MGPERSSPTAQAAYLTEVATQYQRLLSLSLDAKFGSDERFETSAALRLAPKVMARFVTFEKEMARCGHEYSFGTNHDDPASAPSTSTSEGEDESNDSESLKDLISEFVVRKEHDDEEILEILHPQEHLTKPHKKDIEIWLRQVYETSRGFELGTFDSSILATTMKKQSSKWISLSLGYISDVIVIVHRFITTALGLLCYDDGMRRALCNALFDGLLGRYKMAVAQVTFLLEVERNGIPMTLNHYFNDNLEKW